MDTVEVDGLHLAYRLAGQGPTVVHGGAEDSRTWTPQLDALSGQFKVIAWDEQGVGASDDLPNGFGLSDWSQDFRGARA
jgi:pimeloyl-ACP methyl ester carboxylesterase